MPGTSSGLRPFYVELHDADSTNTDILYPLFFYRRYSDSYNWSVFQLINHQGIYAGVTKAGGQADRRLDVWPFYFSHVTDDPLNTYRALMPVYGTVKGQLGFDRLSWTLFPLYVESQKKGTHTTYAPFPFVRVATGAENGFALWPLFGATKGPGTARHFFCLWPLVWHNTLDTPARRAGRRRPRHPDGLPAVLHPGDGAPGRSARTTCGPSSATRSAPRPTATASAATSGRSSSRAAATTRSSSAGARSSPIPTSRAPTRPGSAGRSGTGRRGSTATSGRRRRSSSISSTGPLEQTSVSRPAAAPAYKRHIWPLVSIWDNGAGSRQVQVPSPMEVFFPDNPDMRETWSPFFSLYRYDRRPTGETRSSLLWDAVTWRRDAGDGLDEFHLGPLLGMRRPPSGPGWTILGFDFGAKLNKDRHPSR